MPGTFNCSCTAGYVLDMDGRTCNDVDECGVHLDSCDPTNGVCTNMPGTFNCSCTAGYVLDMDGRTCNDVDECGVHLDSCDPTNGVCTNMPGTFNCSCTAGYVLDMDGRTCNDVDECDVHSGSCDTTNGVCTNIPGTFNCSCTAGYELDMDGRTCNEGVLCGSVMCVNGGECGTTEGNVKCQCPQGYAGEDCGTEPLETRLVNGSGAFEGRVEVYYQGSWGTVCDDLWNTVNSNVVCRSLGYITAAGDYVTRTNVFGNGTGDIILDNVQCVGTETNIAFCPHVGYGNHNCGHDEDVGVICAEPLEIRLVNGNGAFEGRVEVYYQGSWGTVCDDLWNTLNSNVVCRSLGYPQATDFFRSADKFEEGTGNIILDNVECVGNETNIAFCRHAGYRNHNCKHYEDVCVICAENPVDGAVGGDLCGSVICLNGGQCDMTNDAPICTCPSGYEGVDCVTASSASSGGDACESCLNGGECLTTATDTQLCNCPPGFTGLYCETVLVSPTDSSEGVACGLLNLMCLNGGECLKTAAGHQCDCSFGYTGVNCAIAGDDDAVTGEDKIFLTDITARKVYVAPDIEPIRLQSCPLISTDPVLSGDDDAVTGEDKIFLTDITARKVYVAVLGIYTFTALNEDDDPIEAWDIAFDETKQKLYWTNKTDNKIYRGNWDMTERIPVSHGNYSDPTSISIDESRGQIYCAYLGDQVITRIDLDDPDSEINLFGQLTRPSAVELDETNGYLYFTQTGRVYRWNYISESNYDKLYSNYPDVNDIDAIAIEVPANRLSVCDYGNAKVITMDLNGNDPKEVAILSDYKISDILLYKGAYYMSHSGAEDGQMTLLKYALDSESLLNVFNDSDHLFGDVKKIQVANVAMLSLN
eukprot:XP_011678997.1 PREDICTED: fibropellin-1-like [Strongylocentrotus purpuratus]